MSRDMTVVDPDIRTFIPRYSSYDEVRQVAKKVHPLVYTLDRVDSKWPSSDIKHEKRRR